MVSVQDLPEQIQSAADHSRGLSESLHKMLGAAASGTNPYFLKHWNSSQTSGKDKYKEGENHCLLISVVYFPLCVLKEDTDPLLGTDRVLQPECTHICLFIYVAHSTADIWESH